ncbi:amidase [Acidovorax sp. FG27]|uniref:amidase n=1 Tax=Acidovorax sp. FG27 TaxID=3133652 RepID=UPI0030E7FBAA
MTVPSSELAFASMSRLQALLSAGEICSRELVELQLSRIDRLDSTLHAYVDVYREQALAAADGMDALRRAGAALGPLHGMTVAVKDLFDIEGRPTTGGSVAQLPRIAEATSTAVRRLRQAGAIVLGKTHTVEFAFGGWGTNATMGTPRNPWDMQVHRVPGGSSSGSAVAVAAGLACAAIGTDTGGSVRIPAGLCGVVGLKTTHGLISRHGLIELCPTHDTVGPITRDVADCALLLDALAGPDPLDPASAMAPVRRLGPLPGGSVEGLRAWVLPQSEYGKIDAGVLTAYHRALDVFRALGVTMVDKDLPTSLADAMQISGQLMSAEAYARLGPLFERDELRFDPHVRRRILLGRDVSASRYQALLASRARAQASMQSAMADVDVCIFPTNAVGAIALADVDEMQTPLSLLGRFVNLLNLCSLAVPAGFDAMGMPASVQIIGPSFGEAVAMQMGHAYQDATHWHLAHPAGLG